MQRTASRPHSLDALSEVERDAIAKSLVRVRTLERSGAHKAPNISRGVLKAHIGAGTGYDAVHGVLFHNILSDELRSNNGIVRMLDLGCGLGYFLKDMADYAVSLGEGGRFEPHGITLTRNISAAAGEGQPVRQFKPVLGNDIIHVGHGENLQFPNDYFNLVLSTFGPSQYLKGAISPPRLRRFLEESFRVAAPGGRIYIAESIPEGGVDVRRLRAISDFTFDHKDATVDLDPDQRYLRIRIAKNGLPNLK